MMCGIFVFIANVVEVNAVMMEVGNSRDGMQRTCTERLLNTAAVGTGNRGLIADSEDLTDEAGSNIMQQMIVAVGRPLLDKNDEIAVIC